MRFFWMCLLVVSCSTYHVDMMIPPEKRNSPRIRHIVEGIEQSVVFKGFDTRRSLEADDNPIIYPRHYGADPTGKTDSTQAFLKCFEVLLTHWNNHTLAQGAKDLGGATIDLQGGEYLISEPLTVAIYYGNFNVIRGTLRASSTFPKDRYLIEIGGGSDKCTVVQGSCLENVGIQDILFDSSHVAAGALYIGSVMGCKIQSCYFTSFNYRGVYVDRGHETIIDNCWFGEYFWGDPSKGVDETGVAIYLDGHDMFVTNTIIFSALIGIQQQSFVAQVYSNVHAWNGGKGHISYYISKPGNSRTRMIGCTSDSTDMVAVTPYMLTIDDGFFQYCQLVIKSHEPNAVIKHLSIRNSQFDTPTGDKSMIRLDQESGEFAVPVDTVIHDNMVTENGKYKATRLTRELHLENSDEWKFDFSDVLLFNEIKRVEYSITVFDKDVFVRHHACPPEKNTVSIRTDQKVTATVVVTVEQSSHSY